MQTSYCYDLTERQQNNITDKKLAAKRGAISPTGFAASFLSVMIAIGIADGLISERGIPIAFGIDVRLSETGWVVVGIIAIFSPLQSIGRDGDVEIGEAS